MCVCVHVCIEYIERNGCSVHVYGIAHRKEKKRGCSVIRMKSWASPRWCISAVWICSAFHKEAWGHTKGLQEDVQAGRQNQIAYQRRIRIASEKSLGLLGGAEMQLVDTHRVAFSLIHSFSMKWIFLRLGNVNLGRSTRKIVQSEVKGNARNFSSDI